MLTLGIDLGTSGVRLAVIDAHGAETAFVRADYAVAQTPQTDATHWWSAVDVALRDLSAGLGRDMGRIVGIAVAGTSGSMVLVDAALRPVTPALMYNSIGFDAEAEVIARHARPGSITRGSNSALARLLRLQSLDVAGRATHLCHQADLIAARLRGVAGLSEDTNTLKLGWDPETRHWPAWFADAGVRTDLLPRVVRVGTPFGRISADIAGTYGLSPKTELVAGSTDSIAAFLATGAHAVGDAVTSLGTTLVVKLLSDTRIDDAARGVYSHRIGESWLVGGASNTGGGVLRQHFTAADLDRLSASIDPDARQDLDYYPLVRPGERFPVNDPDHPPRLVPRPSDDAEFLHGMLDGIARIEARCYALLAELHAPPILRVLTVGGGASNSTWQAIRQRHLPVPVTAAPTSEASIGMAQLASRST